jgi:hypothetical protein
MAAVDTSCTSCSDIRMSISVDSSTTICVTCRRLNEQIQFVQNELKMANIVISLLSELITEITNLNLTSIDNHQLCSESTSHSTSSSNLNKNMNTEEAGTDNRDTLPPAYSTPVEPSTQSLTGSRIPIIVNGKIGYERNVKSSMEPGISGQWQRRRNKRRSIKHKVRVLDFRFSQCSETCMFSFGYYPGVCLSFSHVSEPSVRSIFKGWMKND